MKISRITQTKKGRFALFDESDTFLFSVDGETLVKNNIVENLEFEPWELENLLAQSDLRKAKDKALRLLSQRDHASQELYQKLCTTFDEHTCVAAIAEMQRLDLIDDAKFARHRAKYLAAQNKSSRDIEQKLRLLGLDRELIRAAIASVEPEDDSACYAIVQKSYKSKLAAGKRDSVLAALARRGFSYGDSKAAIERFLSEEQSEMEPENEFETWNIGETI